MHIYFFLELKQRAVLFCFVNVYTHVFTLAFLISSQHLLHISYILPKEHRVQEPAQAPRLELMYWPTSKVSEGHSLISCFNLIDCLISLPKCLYLRHLIKKGNCGEELQDGGGVRRGDHLPPHKYIRNTSTCGTTPTEHLLNAGRKPQTS